MKGIGQPAIIVLGLLLFSPAFTGEQALSENVRSFSDQDLKKYRYPSETSKTPDHPGPAGMKGTGEVSPTGRIEESTSKRYEVPYVAFEGAARRIIVPVTVNGSVTAPMALDTGAPGMLISQTLAEKLGILSDDRGKVLITTSGLGGSVPAIFTIIDSVRVGEASDHFVPATVVQPLSEQFEGLIGMDFTANYTLQIDTARRVVVFEELPPRPGMAGGHDETWWRLTFRKFSSMLKEWEKYKEDIHAAKDDSGKIRTLRRLADRQVEEADKLLNRLHRYATDHAVPMSWREY